MAHGIDEDWKKARKEDENVFGREKQIAVNGWMRKKK